MKVLFLTNIPSPYRVDFFNELGKNFELTVLYERKQAKDRDEKWEADKPKNFREVFLKGIKVGNESGICFSVINFLKNKQYDQIIVGGYSTPTGMLAIEYLHLNRISFFLSSDGGIIKKDYCLKRLVKRHFISKASAWLSTGQKTTEYLCYYGADANRVYKYPFTSIKDRDILKGVPSVSEKSKVRRRLGIKEKKVIISVGQFIYRKGYDVLLNSSRILEKDIGIYIIGGEPTEEYMKIKKEFDLTNVHFVGFKTKVELMEYYKAADLFVLPTREDIWGLVINEAMANGLPIITTDNCIAGLELIEDYENGFIVPVNDHEKLANRIIDVLDNNELKYKMSENNIKKIKNFTIENMAKSHLEVIDKHFSK
ncbi:glycosyltransferase family 4 protein [Neobacillus sp. 19]|uniref:glycosyltransferase family 4 protein n=1 Tax=Neobacillus sp. 19 TaxID=3394458 RepID=UPI003BF70CA4